MSLLNYLFDLYLHTSIKGAILIILILGIQRFFKKDFTARWIYSLWLFPIIRLLSPFSPIKHSLSLYNLGLVKRLQFTTNDVLLGRFGSASESFHIIGETISTKSFLSSTFTFDWSSFLSLIWITGICILLLFFLSILIKINRIIKNSIKCTDEYLLSVLKLYQKKLSLLRLPTVYISSEIGSPMTYGIVSSKILLPHKLLSDLEKEKLEHILLHELIHIKRKDVLFTHLGMLICVLHWFNPFVWIGFLRSKEDCELACDESVLYTLTPKEYTQYGFTLIQMLEYISSDTSYTPVIAKTLLRARSEANTRILHISKFHRKRKSIVFISICLLFFIAFVGFNESSHTRISKQYRDYTLSKYLNTSEQQIRLGFGAKPKQTFFIHTNDSPYFILYYNILGEKVEFWFDGTIGNDTRRALEITTTSYKGFYQGMSFKKMKKVAQEQSYKIMQRKKSHSSTQYIFKDTDSSFMILVDDSTNRVYSITIFREPI